MTTKQLNNWIETPELLNKESLEVLRQILESHPYFQTVRLLYLRNLYLLHDERFGAELRKAALHITDRRILFNLFYLDAAISLIVEEKDCSDKVVESDKEPNIDRTLQLIDTFLSERHTEPKKTLTYATVSDYSLLIEKELQEKNTEAVIQEVNPSTNMDLENRLITTEQIAIEASEEPTIEQEQEQAGEFIADQETPTQTKDKGEKQELDEEEKEDSPDLNIYDEEECLTETLAKIYIRQHKFSKALEIFKKLSLKYPKKSAYFADQIRFLEKLITNIKSE